MFDLIKTNLLKITMLVDGAFSLLAGVVFSTFSEPIAGLLGPAFAAGAVLGVGVFLIVWGIFHLAAAGAKRISPAALRVAIAGDALWVIASAALLVADWNGLSAIGIAVIAVLAVAVADIMLLKLIGQNNQRRLAIS